MEQALKIEAFPVEKVPKFQTEQSLEFQKEYVPPGHGWQTHSRKKLNVYATSIQVKNSLWL